MHIANTGCCNPPVYLFAFIFPTHTITSLFLEGEPEPTVDPTLSYPSPTDLRFSDLGSREVMLHWTNPAKPVKQYRVVYHSAEGQSPQEVRDFSSTSSFFIAMSQCVVLYPFNHHVEPS